MDLTPRDREFVNDLAFKIAEKHVPAVDAAAARGELAKDIAEAVAVCLLAKGYRRGPLHPTLSRALGATDALTRKSPPKNDR